MSPSVDLYDRAFHFACGVLRLDRSVAKDRRVNRNAINQLLRSATSIGANLEEARAAQSRADFHLKVRISLKEARESHYWLRLLSVSGCLEPSDAEPLLNQANELVAILTSIAKKTNPRNPQPPPTLHS